MVLLFLGVRLPLLDNLGEGSKLKVAEVCGTIVRDQ